MSLISRKVAAPPSPSRPVVEWEEVDCLLCGSAHWQPLLEAPDTAPDGSGLWFGVVRCLDCGLCFTNPRPTRRSMAPFYPPLYQPHHRRELRRRWHWHWHRRRRERQTLPWQGQGRLLDFGCGNGSYLERMHRQGWQVTGVDTSANAIQRIRSELGLRALHGTLPHPLLGPESFDVITMWHSLEHVHDPLEVLHEAYRLLVPGGKLLVAVPNIDSLPFRWFGPAWYSLDLPRHLTHFGPRTLRRMLQRAGFDIHRVRLLRHSDWLRSSAVLACRHPATLWWQHWLRSKPLSRLVTWYSFLTGQSDCLLITARR